MSATRLPWLLRFGGIAMQPRPFRCQVNLKAPRLHSDSELSYQAEGGTIYLGDVISVPRGDGVFPDLADKFFRVTQIKAGHISLSMPYHDKALTRPYRPDTTKYLDPYFDKHLSPSLHGR